jgi:glycosyl transferase family 1
MNSASASRTSIARDTSKQLVLFHRDFRVFTGGHLKVWDYFNHVASSRTHEPRIAFSPESRWDSTNPWFNSQGYFVEWEPEKADVLFLAGTDWRALPDSKRRRFDKPIINLIQHPRHAAPESELRGFLKSRAVRICVSKEVADTIKATGEVNGPVFAIPNAIDLSCVPEGKPWNERTIDVLIGGLKAPELTRDIQAAFADQNWIIQCLTEWIPRKDYLARVNNAKIALFLPRPVEGFYLPPLEGMAARTIVVCPDCLGNRGFCDDKVNCFRPQYDSDEIVAAVRSALQQSQSERARMLENATVTVRKHSLEKERESFLQILRQIGELWKT